MKKIHWLCLACLAPLSASAEIFISEYVEGSSFNKAIEIFNPDQTSVDLSNYQLKLYQNGNTTAQYTINLSGTLVANNTYVIAHKDISDSSQVDLLVGNLQHNGDDAIVLEKQGQIIDVIGKVGQDPGSQWGTGLTSTKDNTLVRLSNITMGDTDSSDDFDPSIQWQGFENNTLSYLGSHNGELSDTPDDSTDEDDSGDINEDQSCGLAFAPIHEIQGSNESTPLAAEAIWVEGIVTANMQNSGYKGFYLQSADNEIDDLVETSQGIFVYNNSFDINVGDRIRLKATPSEYNGLTQLSSVDTLSICQTNVTLPSATNITLPMAEESREHYESMLVSFEQPLYVTDTYNYGRYGQLGLASERLFNPTQIATPGEDANNVAALNLSKSIILDDGDTAQNPERLPYPSPELDAFNTIRSGDKVTNLHAVLTYSFGDYQLIPVNTVNVEPTNPRTSAPQINADSDIRVASFNVLNYFNGDGEGNGFPTARGAISEVEFNRQREKIIAAISALNADIIGLMEIENDGYLPNSAIVDLVSGLNESYGENVYQFVTPPTQKIGDDAITVGLIYRSDKVELSEAAKVLDSNNSPVDTNQQPLFLDSKNRPMLAQKFSLLTSGENLVVAVNHLKSKGSDCNSLNDPDLLDGQGNCNLTRTRASQAIGQFLTNNYPDQAALIIGDLNAYAKEDPISALNEQGYADVFVSLNKQMQYSYIFNGELGQLDHALSNNEMTDKIVDVNIWPINADEPRSLDYSTQYKSEIQQAKYYAPDAYRSSDHDPIIIDIKLTQQAMFGDLDADQDVDKDDINLFNQQVRQKLITDMAYDFNKDGQLNSRDIRGLMQLCTRDRCKTN